MSYSTVELEAQVLCPKLALALGAGCCPRLAEHGSAAQAVLCFGTNTLSLYRPYPSRRIPIHCLYTLWSEVQNVLELPGEKRGLKKVGHPLLVRLAVPGHAEAVPDRLLEPLGGLISITTWASSSPAIHQSCAVLAGTCRRRPSSTMNSRPSMRKPTRPRTTVDHSSMPGWTCSPVAAPPGFTYRSLIRCRPSECSVPPAPPRVLRWPGSRPRPLPSTYATPAFAQRPQGAS